MKELSLNILDIAKNSVTAGASRISITLTQDESNWLTIRISDNGCGMNPEFLATVTDPFTTTRSTRKVGMGLPLYRLAAEQTGGTLDIQSTEGVGTTVTATFNCLDLDCPPLGDIAGTIALLIQGSPDVAFEYRHITPSGSVKLSTDELKDILGEDISLAELEVFAWIQDYLSEHEAQLEGAG